VLIVDPLDCPVAEAFDVVFDHRVCSLFEYFPTAYVGSRFFVSYFFSMIALNWRSGARHSCFPDILLEMGGPRRRLGLV